MAIIELKAISALLEPTHIAYEGPYPDCSNGFDIFIEYDEGSISNGYYRITKHHGMVSAIRHLAIKNKGLGFIRTIERDGTLKYCCGRDTPLEEDSIKFWKDEYSKLPESVRDHLYDLEKL